MDFSSAIKFMQNFETAKIMGYLEAVDPKTLMEHPYFLAGIGILAIIAYFMRWRLLLVTVMTLTGFIYLLNYTLAQGTSLDGGLGNTALMVLVGGGSFILFLAIYLLFIREE